MSSPVTASPARASGSAVGRASGTATGRAAGAAVGRATGTAIGVVIEHGRLSAGLVSSGSVVVRDRVGTPTRDVWRTLRALVERVVAATPSDVPAADRIGVSCVGPIDRRAGSVSPASIPAWSGFALAPRLDELCGLPVVLESFAAAGADSERVDGAGRDLDAFVFVHLDRAIDSAVDIGGRRLGGHHGNAGALAHVVVDPGGRRCPCGAVGCLQAYASAAAIEAETNRPLARATGATVERAGLMVGRALSSALAVFDAQDVIVGGVVVDTFGADILEPLQRELAQRSAAAGVELHRASSTRSPIIAAAALAQAAELDS